MLGQPHPVQTNRHRVRGSDTRAGDGHGDCEHCVLFAVKGGPARRGRVYRWGARLGAERDAGLGGGGVCTGTWMRRR